MQSATNDGATLRVATTAHHVNAPIDSSITTPYTDVKRKSVPVQNPPDDLESCIREAFNAAVTLGRRAVEEAHLCGTLLIEAKLWTEHGEWLPLLARVGIAARTAQRFMRLADTFKCAELGAFASVEAAERALLPAPAPPAEYRPTGPAFDSEAAWDRIPAVLEEGVELEAACRLALLTQHATQTGALPADPGPLAGLQPLRPLRLRRAQLRPLPAR